MKKSVAICSYLAGALLLAVNPSPALATCSGGLVQPLQHAFGGSFDKCPDLNPVRAFAYVLGNASAVNSGSVDIACEDNQGTNDQGPCQFEAGSRGDGNVTISFNWGGTGTFPGCPNPAEDPGVGRNVVQLVANDGSSVLVTVGYSRDLGFQYALDCAAQPAPTGAAAPLSCSHRDAGMTITTLDSTNLCVHIPPPKIYSDCDAGTMCGPEPNPLGIPTTCVATQIPTTSPGRLYRRDAPCGTSQEPQLSLGWTLVGAPDGNGDICILVPRPADPAQCVYLGASGTVGGTETLATTGVLEVAGQNAPSARALDVRAAASTGDIVVTWHTAAELDLGGFNILAETKAKGRIKVNDALIVPKGVSGGGAPYEVSIPRGKFQGGRTLYVESVTTSGSKILSDPAKF